MSADDTAADALEAGEEPKAHWLASPDRSGQYQPKHAAVIRVATKDGA